MSFCTACGHANADENQFCEECGTRLRRAPASPLRNPTATRDRRAPISRKALIIGSIGAGVLAAAAVAASWMLSNESASPEHLQAAVDRYLIAKPTANQKRYCLRNFAYDKDTVEISSYDLSTRRWLTVLVAAGLYGEPEEAPSSNGFFVTRNLRYSKTEAGRAATATGALCIAKGLVVKRVEGVRAYASGDKSFADAQVTYGLKDVMPWVDGDPSAKKSFPGLGEDFTESVSFAPKNRRWEVATPEERPMAGAPSRPALSDRGADSPGLLARLMSGFSAGGNPAQGTWRADIMGVPALWEFGAQTLKAPGQKPTRVRYEVQGKTVKVFLPDGPQVMEVLVNSDDTATIRTDGLSFNAKRIQR